MLDLRGRGKMERRPCDEPEFGEVDISSASDKEGSRSDGGVEGAERVVWLK